MNSVISCIKLCLIIDIYNYPEKMRIQFYARYMYILHSDKYIWRVSLYIMWNPFSVVLMNCELPFQNRVRYTVVININCDRGYVINNQYMHMINMRICIVHLFMNTSVIPISRYPKQCYLLCVNVNTEK